MASLAAQLMDVFYGIVGRITGYGAQGEDGNKASVVAGAHEPSMVASAEAFRPEEVIEIRSRNRDVSGGSGAQVNLNGS